MSACKMSAVKEAEDVLKSSYAEIDAIASLNEDQKNEVKHALKEFSKGETSFAKAAHLSDDFLEDIYGSAFRLFMSGHYERARLLFSMLCEFDHTESRYLFATATCYHKLHHYEEASKYYMDALVYDRGNPLIYYHLFDCFSHMKEKELAAGALTSAYFLAAENKRFEKLKNQIALEYEGLLSQLFEKNL